MNLVDDTMRIVVRRVIGEGTFNYKYTWQINSDIIGTFIGCLARARVELWAMIRLYCNIFDPV